MIFIYHGEDSVASRNAFLDHLTNLSSSEILRVDSKTPNLDQINNFIQGNTLFYLPKVLAISNLFSIPKASQDSLISIIKQAVDDVIIWQDKSLKATQTKLLPSAKLYSFKLDNQVFACLNQVKPQNAKNFLEAYVKVIDQGLFDLFLYLLKGNLRRQLTSYSKFNVATLKNTYLQLIELDFQNKTGQLTIPKDIALERTILNLIK